MYTLLLKRKKVIAWKSIVNSEHYSSIYMRAELFLIQCQIYQ